MPVFGKEPEDKAHRVMSEMINRINDKTKRLRDLERAYDSMANRSISIEQDILAFKKASRNDINDIKIKLGELSTEIDKLTETAKEIMKQLKFFATKTKVEELESMLNIFNPLESVFVTKDDVKRIVREEIKG